MTADDFFDRNNQTTLIPRKYKRRLLPNDPAALNQILQNDAVGSGGTVLEVPELVRRMNLGCNN